MSCKKFKSLALTPNCKKKGNRLNSNHLSARLARKPVVGNLRQPVDLRCSASSPYSIVDSPDTIAPRWSPRGYIHFHAYINRLVDLVVRFGSEDDYNLCRVEAPRPLYMNGHTYAVGSVSLDMGHRIDIPAPFPVTPSRMFSDDDARVLVTFKSIRGTQMRALCESNWQCQRHRPARTEEYQFGTVVAR